MEIRNRSRKMLTFVFSNNYRTAFMTEKNTETPPQEQPKAQATDKQSNIWSLRSSFPSIADLLVLLGMFAVANLVAGILGLIVGFSFPDMKQLLSDDEAIRTGAQYAAAPYNAFMYGVAMTLTLIGFLFYRRRRGGISSIGSFSFKGLNPLLLVWGAVLLISSSVVLEPLLNIMPSPPDFYGRGFWAVVMIVVMAPLFEEVLCRGILIDSARAKWGTTGAWLLSSLVFGLLHFYPAAVVNAFVIGLIFGFIYIKTGSLWVPILLHAFNNGVAYLSMVSSGRSDMMLIDLVGSRILYGLIYIAALAVFVISGYMILRTLKNPRQA